MLAYDSVYMPYFVPEDLFKGSSLDIDNLIALIRNLGDKRQERIDRYS